MPQFSRTWWGKRFIATLEEFSDSARLGRGRSYARNGKIKEYKITNGKISAKVRGFVNPYFGVYKEPLYNTTIEIEPISAADWSKAISYLSSRASFVSKLLMNDKIVRNEQVLSKRLVSRHRSTGQKPQRLSSSAERRGGDSNPR